MLHHFHGKRIIFVTKIQEVVLMVTQYLCFSSRTRVHPSVLLSSFSHGVRQVFTPQYRYRHSAMVSDKISVHPTVLLSSLSHGVRQDRCSPNSTVVVTQHWEESELLLLFPFRGCGEQRQSHYLRNGRGVSSAITTPTIPEKSRSAEETEKRSY